LPIRAKAFCNRRSNQLPTRSSRLGGPNHIDFRSRGCWKNLIGARHKCSERMLPVGSFEYVYWR
jgi:hypothetical protein